MKLVDNLKKEFENAQSSLREKTLAAETAQAKLNSSEASWNQQKQVLDKEVTDLNARYAPYCTRTKSG